MKFNQIEDFKKLTLEEINQKIIIIKQELFDLKFQQATKQKIKTHVFKNKKHSLAQLLMLEKQKIS